MLRILLIFTTFTFSLFCVEVNQISGLLLTPEYREEIADSDEVIDIQISCDQELMRDSLKQFIGMPLSERTLIEMKKNIREVFALSDDAFYLVQIPEQKIAFGRVQMIVRPAKIRKVEVKGNKWYSTHQILNKLDIQQGKRVCESDLLNRAAWMNRIPFIHSDVILAPGRRRAETDVEVLIKDRFLARFYAGADNTGNSFSGNERFYGGFNVSLGLKGLLNYQFTSGFNFPEYQAHYANTTFFFPWMHEIVFYGGYSKMHPKIPSFRSEGKSVQVSMRYQAPFKPLYKPFQHQIYGGIDYKMTDSALFFLGTRSDGTLQEIQQNAKTADLFQWMMGYQLKHSWDRYSLTMQFDVFTQPFTFLTNQKQSDYDALRPGAKVHYAYAKTAFGFNYRMPYDITFSSLVRGQVASAALLPSEQFGLGGYDTVRGYQERVTLADNAVVGNFELRSPSVSLIKILSKKNKSSIYDSLTFLIFLDTAYGYTWRSSGAFPASSYLMGAGPGVRYQILPYLTARADYGFRIHNTQFGNSQIGRFHFSVTAGY